MVHSNRYLIGLALFFSIMFFYGCRAVLKSFYGIHEPRIESQKGIKEYAYKKGIDTAHFFYYIDKRKVKRAYERFPRVLFFDRSGNMIASGNCFATLKETSHQLFTEDSPQIISTGGLKEELVNVVSSDNKPVSYNSADADITIFYYWGKFLGKLNKDRLGWLEKRAREARTKKINIVKVNVDLQEEWNLTEQQYKELFAKQ